MKRIEKMLLYGSGYTVLILTLYFLVAGFATGFSNFTVSFGRFLLILLFGFIIAGAGFLYNLLSVKKWLRILLHYAILLATFCLIFIPGLNVSNNGPATTLAWILIFTVLYCLISFVVHFITKAINKFDEGLDASTAPKKTTTKRNNYTPLYTDRGENNHE